MHSVEGEYGSKTRISDAGSGKDIESAPQHFSIFNSDRYTLHEEV